MLKLLVAVFESETAAFKGLNALNELHADGDITLYATAVVKKDLMGEATLQQEADAGPVGSAIGMLSGALLGLLAGPAGAAVGGTAGAMTGLLYDVYGQGVSAEFLDDVSRVILPGHVAVVAEVEESWTAPIDTRMHDLGGSVFRRYKSEVEDDQIARESMEFDAELDALNAEMEAASAERKAAIQKNIDAVKKQITMLKDRAKARMEETKENTQSRIKVLEDQAKSTTGRAKARIEERIAATKARNEQRSAKLKQAMEMAKDAFKS